MSRRESSGPSNIPHNVSEDNRRDDRPPSVPLTRYIEQTMSPSTPHSRSDRPQYTPYNPPPTSRPSYPPDPHSRVDNRHNIHPQRHMDLPRSHERGVVYSRQGPYYPQEGGIPPVHQPAPRQRTAVACRYCRRRKIRCSGYQSSPDGRCTNCVQRDQKCEFLPVSASPYEAPRPEASYMTPPQSAPQVPIGTLRPSQQYGIPPPPPPTYHLSTYTSHQQRKPLARPADELLSPPPRKRQAIDPTSSGKPTLAPIQTGSTMRRRPTSQELLSGYTEVRLSTPHLDYGQRSPPYTSVVSPQRRRESIYSTASTIPHPPSSAILSSRSSEVSPYALLPPPPPPRSPVRTTPVHARRFSYQPHTPYSPEQVYSARPTSQGGTHIRSPMSAVPLPPPPLTYSRSSPILRYAPGPLTSRLSTEYLDRPTISPGYEYGESTSLPPLAHLNRETPPIQSATNPAMPSPLLVSLPPPSGMITAPRNPRDSEILSAFDTISDSSSSRPPLPPPRPPPSPPLKQRTPTPDPARKHN